VHPATVWQITSSLPTPPHQPQSYPACLLHSSIAPTAHRVQFQFFRRYPRTGLALQKTVSSAKTSPIDWKSASKINPKSPRPPLPDTPNLLHRPYKTTGYCCDGLQAMGNDLIGQDGHAVAMSLSPCAQRGRCLFSFLAGMLSQHGFASRDVILSDVLAHTDILPACF